MPESVPPAAARPPQIVQLNQGWSEREAEFYAHADEGTNLAPLDFLVNLPDPAKPGARFIDKLTTDYGFIASDKSASNPQGLPVGFTVDDALQPSAIASTPASRVPPATRVS